MAHNTLLQGIVMLTSIVIAFIMVESCRVVLWETLHLASAGAARSQSLSRSGPKNFLPSHGVLNVLHPRRCRYGSAPRRRLYNLHRQEYYDVLKRSGALISLITLVWFMSLFVSASAAGRHYPLHHVPVAIFPTIKASVYRQRTGRTACFRAFRSSHVHGVLAHHLQRVSNNGDITSESQPNASVVLPSR